MAKYLILLVLLLPLSGILIMEQGVVSLTSYEIGYPNGASLMYTGYVLVVLLLTWLMQKIHLPWLNLKKRSLSNFNIESAALIALILNIIICLVILFGFGSINVLMGNINKGDFRISLGSLGFVAMGISRWTAPALLTFGTFIFVKSKHVTPISVFIISSHFLICAFMGASWGFKSFAITILIPALIVLLRNAKFHQMALAGALAFVGFLGFSMLFDDTSIQLSGAFGDEHLFDRIESENALAFVVYRATVLQGDVSWIMWERYISGVEFPVYWWNLVGALGNNILGFFLTTEEIKFFSYTNQLTAMAANRSINSLDFSYNVTGTVFSEGLMAGGVKGVAVFSVLAGIITGFVYRMIHDAMNKHNLVVLSIGCVFFFKVFNWLNGGNIVTLFHFSNIIFIVLTIILLTLILAITSKRNSA